MDHFRRHNFIWKLLRRPARFLMFHLLGYRPYTRPIDAPALIVSNHCTDLDPILLGLTINNHAYFVASDHIFRKKAAGRFLRWAQDPIARTKGTTAGDTALRIVRTLRKGRSVALFAEGNRTFNGLTGAIVESTAKLAKVSGASLVTHRFTGGYLTSPRWAGASIRKGRLVGEIVGIYPPEDLKKMTADEVAELIRRDIRVDARDAQREWEMPYKGRRLAEHLERALCLCPRCGGMSTLRSEGDRFSCSACGMAGIYTPLGYLEGTVPFRTVTEWDLWQAGEIQKRVDAAPVNLCLAADPHTELYGLDDDGGELLLRKGELSVYRDRLECAGQVIPFDAVTGMNLNGPQTMILTAGGQTFTIKSPEVCNMRKYLTIYHAAVAPDRLLDL